MADTPSGAAADLSGRRAVVTGGGSGIGAACAERLASLGAHVTVADVAADAARAVAQKVGGRAWQVDLSETAALEAALDSEGLDIDILVNNAGLQHVSPIGEFPPERWRLMHRIMVEAPFLLVRAALPGMVQRGWGRVVNISSVHGLRASPFKSAYVSAKHALEGLSKTVALEGGPHGVTSNCVCPAYVRTPLVEKQIADQARAHDIPEDQVVAKVMLTETAIKRLIEPAEVADTVGYLCSESAAFVTGASLTMDGGWTAR